MFLGEFPASIKATPPAKSPTQVSASDGEDIFFVFVGLGGHFPVTFLVNLGRPRPGQGHPCEALASLYKPGPCPNPVETRSHRKIAGNSPTGGEEGADPPGAANFEASVWPTPMTIGRISASKGFTSEPPINPGQDPAIEEVVKCQNMVVKVPTEAVNRSKPSPFEHIFGRSEPSLATPSRSVDRPHDW